MGTQRPAADDIAVAPKRLRRSEEPTPGLLPAQSFVASAPTPSAPTPARPNLPPREDVDADVPNLMRAVVKYVQYFLKSHLADNPLFFSAFQDIELHAHSPLEIK